MLKGDKACALRQIHPAPQPMPCDTFCTEDLPFSICTLCLQADGEEGVFCEADQLLQTDADDVHAQLAELLNGSFAILCDVKAAGADQYYRLSNEKASTMHSAQMMP